MFEDFEETYIANNTDGKKYKNIIVPTIIGIVILMFVLFIIKNIILLYIVSFITVLLMVILKFVIYIKTVKPNKLLEIVFVRKKYKAILYNKTKEAIKKIIKEKNNYNKDGISIMINYYKDLKPTKNIDASSIFNVSFSFLSLLGVLVTVENTEFINVLYKLIFCLLGLIGLFFIENRILDKLSDGILDSQINYKQIYKILNEIYLEIISNNNVNIETNFVKGDNMELRYIQKTPTADEFNDLTEEVGWGRRTNKIVEEALNNTLYTLCVYDRDKLIGYGRIIGDKTIFLYIHDVMVIPEYQGKQIGTGIMKELLKQVEEYKKVNPNIRTYLGASKGKESFYEKFGFVARPNEELGAGMILYND